jgi:hypothetical protein
MDKKRLVLIDLPIQFDHRFQLDSELVGTPESFPPLSRSLKAQILAATVNAGYHNSKYPQNRAGHVCLFSVWNICGGVHDRRK